MSVKKVIVLALMFVTFIATVYADTEIQQNIISINPNPVEKCTVISVTFIERSRADIIIETLDGSLIKTLFSGNLEPGVYEYFWARIGNNGSYVPEGRYYVTVNYETRYTSTKKTLILK